MGETNGFGSYEDLINDITLQLEELLALIKFLGNSTFFPPDYTINMKDVNAITATIHDKTINTMFTAQKLRAALQNLNV